MRYTLCAHCIWGKFSFLFYQCGTAGTVDLAGAVELGGKPCGPPTDSNYPFQVSDCSSHGDLKGHNDLAHHMVHRKKSFSIFPSPAQQDVTYQTLPIAGNNLYMTPLSRPGRVWQMTSRLGTGILKSFFYGVLRGLQVLQLSNLGDDSSNLWPGSKRNCQGRVR